MRAFATAALAMFVLPMASLASAQLPNFPPEKVLQPGGMLITQAMIESDVADLLSVMSELQRQKVGKVSVKLESPTDGGPCATTLSLAQSSHASGQTRITFCREGLRLLSDSTTVAAVFPFLGTLSIQQLYTRGDLPMRYAMLQIKSVKIDHGKLQLPIRYCSPYVYLAEIAANPTADPTCADRSGNPAGEVIAKLDSSALLKSMVAVNASLKHVDSDFRPSQYMAFSLVLFTKGAIDFLLAHELSHQFCEGACAEAEIDKIALDLISRSPSSAGVVANIESSQSVLKFSSFFSDINSLIFLSNMNTEVMKRQVVLRQAAVACAGLTQLTELDKKYEKGLETLDAIAKAKGGAVNALAGGNLALLRLKLISECEGFK